MMPAKTSNGRWSGTANHRPIAIIEYRQVVTISHCFAPLEESEMVPTIGLAKAAMKLDNPTVHVHIRVPVFGSFDSTSTKYRENINVIIMADQAELAQSYSDQENRNTGEPILTLDLFFICNEVNRFFTRE